MDLQEIGSESCLRNLRMLRRIHVFVVRVSFGIKCQQEWNQKDSTAIKL
jgi:hypothetical protein